MMRIERTETGGSWLVVQITEHEGRRIIHSRRDSLESALAYLSQTWHTEPTREELDALTRDDERVRFRQRMKREPTEDELTDAVDERESEPEPETER